MNLTRVHVFGDTTIDVTTPTLASAKATSAPLAVDLTFENAKGLMMMEPYACNLTHTTIDTAIGLLNHSCCDHQGLGVVKLRIHPPIVVSAHNSIEWIPAQLKISSDGNGATATGVLPGAVTAEDSSFIVLGVSINLGESQWVLANANGMPVPIAGNTRVMHGEWSVEKHLVR